MVTHRRQFNAASQRSHTGEPPTRHIFSSRRAAVRAHPISKDGVRRRPPRPPHAPSGGVPLGQTGGVRAQAPVQHREPNSPQMRVLPPAPKPEQTMARGLRHAGESTRTTAAGGRRACAFACVAQPPRHRLLWFGGGGEDSHLRTVGLSVLNWGLCANPTSLAERHAAAGGVRRPRGTAANPILRYRMGPHGGPPAAENVACWGLSCVTPLARRVKLAPVCDQPQPRPAPPGRWGCERRPGERARDAILCVRMPSYNIENGQVGLRPCVPDRPSKILLARAGVDPVLLPPLVWCVRFIYLFY